MESTRFGSRFPHSLKLIKCCNILVIGRTGVGKSTLISTLFNEPINEPITKKISDKPFTKAGLALAAYDTPGIERDKKQRDKVKKDIASFIKEKSGKEPNEQIHAVWFCVNSQESRGTEIDTQWISSIAKELPVIAVITRSCGAEKKELQPYLKRIPDIQEVIPVLAQEEADKKPYGLDNLLSTTENLLENMAEKAINQAINAKANHAYAWSRDGSAKVLAVQIIPGAKLTTGLFQTRMLMDIANCFDCQFDSKYLRKICKILGTSAGFDSFNLFLEEQLRNIPGIDYTNIQTVHDVLSHLANSLEHITAALPFGKEHLIGVITDLSNSHWVGALPLLSCITAIANTLCTGFLGLAFVETMKKYKKAEYEGTPMPDIEELMLKEIKQLIEVIREFTGSPWIPNFAG